MSRMSPFALGIFSTLLVSSLIALVLALVFWTIGSPLPIFHVLLIFLICFVFSGLAFRYLYRKYIFSGLIQIYYNILKLRHPRQPVRPIEPTEQDVTKKINRILIDWDNESREEIDQLKQVEVYRREFLSNVSHELKTPIFSIQGYVHTLLDGGIEDQDINLLYLNKASKSLDRLISIVDDLESISRIEAGELMVERRTFDISDLTKDVIELLEMQASDKNVQLHVKESSDRPYYVFADKEMIRQVLVNLLMNSIKYGKREGHTEVRFTDADDRILVDIEDDGIGIEKQHLPRLFERFYRVDKSRSRDQGGTGLGLAIVKHIVEAHGEKISVNSEPGKGTVFTFSVQKSR